MPKKTRYTISPEDHFVKKANFFLASFFGLGFSPVAPGTLGSLAALPLAWFFIYIGGIRGLLLGTLVIFVLGYMVAAVAVRYTDEEDPSFIVVDEVVGQLITFLLPVSLFTAHAGMPLMYIAGFVLFRLFDILKPWHVGWADKKVKGATGIMLDDIIAALYSTVLLTLGLFVYNLITRNPVVL